VAQLVEHHLAKVRVAGSSPVVRSTETPGLARGFLLSTCGFASAGLPGGVCLRPVRSQAVTPVPGRFVSQLCPSQCPADGGRPVAAGPRRTESDDFAVRLGGRQRPRESKRGTLRLGGRMEPERLTLTVEESAKLLSISRNLAYELVADGRLPSIRLGRRVLVPRQALYQLLEEVSAR
jgi:excisionase family DNA binding protein